MPNRDLGPESPVARYRDQQKAGRFPVEPLKTYDVTPWLRAWHHAWMLGLEASQVIALRTLKMASGDRAAVSEVNRMVSEKIAAGLELQAKALMAAGSGSLAGATGKALRHYRGKVRANRRRLVRKKSS